MPSAERITGFETLPDYSGCYLPVTFDGKPYKLEWQNKGKPGELDVWIAFFDPLKNVELGKSASHDLSKILTPLSPDVVISPPSTRSIPMVKEAVRLTGEMSGKPIYFIKLNGGYKRNEAEGDSQGSIVKEYSPITAHGKTKYIGISASDLQIVREASASSMKIAFIDDVVSTGATIEAMKKLLNGSAPQDIPIVAAILERTYLNGRSQPVYPDVYAVMENPAIIRTLT